MDQTTDGQPLGDELEDAWQGTDKEATRRYMKEQRRFTFISPYLFLLHLYICNFCPTENPSRTGKSLNSYGESLETREEAEVRLKASATDAKARSYQAEVSDEH